MLGSAYMDDAVWFANSREEMQRRVEVQQAFCTYHGVRLNLDKSTYTCVPTKGKRSGHVSRPIEVNGVMSKVGSLEGHFKYLGILMSPLGVVKHEVGKLRSEVFGIYD